MKHLDAWKRFKQFQARKITCAKNMSTIKQGLPGVAKKGFGSGKIDDEDASSEGTESDTCSFDAAARQPQKKAAKRQGKVKTAVSVARLERKQAEAEHARSRSMHCSRMHAWECNTKSGWGGVGVGGCG